MKNKASNLFFLWTYFGIDTEMIPADILVAVINKAYEDATVRGAFDRSALPANEIAGCKKVACDSLFGAIYGLYPELDFSEWHKDICKEIVSKTAFSYGNAQKLINMAIKYLYLLADFDFTLESEIPDYRSWYEYRLKVFEEEVHIPIDNFVLQYIYEDKTANHTNWGEEEHINILRISSTQYSISIGKENYPWSKIPDYKTYMKIQNAIKSYYKPKNPLEWENMIWLKTASKRKIKNR